LSEWVIREITWRGSADIRFGRSATSTVSISPTFGADVTRSRTSPTWLVAIVATTTLLLASAACGGGGDELTAADPTVTTAGAEEGGNDDAAAPSEQDDPANPLVLGYQVTGEPGTELEIEVVAVADGVAQQAFDQTPILRDEPFWMLFTTFIDSATITISISEGEPATLEVFYGRAVDPENPTLGVDIVDLLETIEVGSEPITVELP
jgi:hypothetical protein